ncbi:MAG: tyrosine-type recombinase/integrase [Prevotella sp.]|nr:tyrosine-type recombinase/integrase [Alistipes senegalensis]MCM1358466.1 tyrosine-type recombinase/integrase [Prevotella sp.]
MTIYRELCFKELSNFIDYCENEKKSSENTIYNYFRDLLLFFRYMKFIKGKSTPAQEIERIMITDIDVQFLESISTEDIYRYIEYLKIKKNNSSTTVARRVSSVKAFFRYLNITADVISQDPSLKLQHPEITREPIKYISESDCITLLKSITGLNSQRDYCIILIFINCGIRLNELISLNNSDIQPDGTVTIRGREESRTIYFNKSCMEALAEYSRYKKEYFKGKRYDHHAVFIGQGGKRLSGRWVELIVKKRMKKAGFTDKGLNPSNLRHTAATIMHKHGVDIATMRDILGHSAISSTEIYSEKNNSKIEIVMKNHCVDITKK